MVRLALLLLVAGEAWAGPECKIALARGAFAADSITGRWILKPEDYFADYRRFFEAKGCEVRFIDFPPDATIEVRSLVLRDQIERFAKEKGEGISIIAHSQAGMDARYALKSLGMKGVRHLVTIGTPHAGTPLANWVVEHRDQGSLLYWVLKVLGRYDLKALSFAGEFRPEFLREKSRYFEAVSGVNYSSARALCKTGCHWGLKLVAWWTGVGSGDGIVPGESQRFGQDMGEYDLDHISSVDASPEKSGERARLLNAIAPAQ